MCKLFLTFLLNMSCPLIFQFFHPVHKYHLIFPDCSLIIPKLRNLSPVAGLSKIFHPVFQQTHRLLIILHVTGLFFHMGKSCIKTVIDRYTQIQLAKIAGSLPCCPVNMK